MRLAGKDELYRTVAVFEQSKQTFLVAQKQRSPFVGGKAPGETDGQSVRLERNIGRGPGQSVPAALKMAPHIADKRLAA